MLAQQVNELFQCQPSSSPGNEQTYSPNIPDIYFHHTNISESTTNLSAYRSSISAEYNVFRVGMLQDCTGTVMSVQYCYRGPRSLSVENSETTIFQLGIGTLTDGSEPFFDPNSQFSLIPVQSVPDGSKCTSADGTDIITCCDKTDINQFTYYNSNDNFAYVLGVDSSSDVQLLAFAGLDQFDLNAYQVVNFGQQISLVGSFRVELGLPVLRFFIGINYVAIGFNFGVGTYV